MATICPLKETCQAVCYYVQLARTCQNGVRMKINRKKNDKDTKDIVINENITNVLLAHQFI